MIYEDAVIINEVIPVIINEVIRSIWDHYNKLRSRFNNKIRLELAKMQPKENTEEVSHML